MALKKSRWMLSWNCGLQIVGLAKEQEHCSFNKRHTNLPSEMDRQDNALSRRVVCDDILKKREPDLAYLDAGRFNVTQMCRDAVMKLK